VNNERQKKDGAKEREGESNDNVCVYGGYTTLVLTFLELVQLLKFLPGKWRITPGGKPKTYNPITFHVE